MKAVLVFCEGRHDVVFAQRSLGTHANCEWVDTPIVELPSPFGENASAKKGFIAARLERQAPVKTVAHQLPPCFESIVENTTTDTMFFMIRTQGKTQSGPIVDLLRSLDQLFNLPSDTFDTSEYATAFLFDANSEGVEGTLEGFRNRYGEFFGDLSNVCHGRWVTSDTVPVGCFVFHKNTQDPTGTLEDHLGPMVRSVWPTRFTEAEQFVSDKRSANDIVSGSESERLKATITIAGQFNHPGDPMSIIIGRSGVPRTAFENSKTSKNLSKFLTRIPWQGA